MVGGHDAPHRLKGFRITGPGYPEARGVGDTCGVLGPAVNDTGGKLALCWVFNEREPVFIRRPSARIPLFPVVPFEPSLIVLVPRTLEPARSQVGQHIPGVGLARARVSALIGGQPYRWMAIRRLKTARGSAQRRGSASASKNRARRLGFFEFESERQTGSAQWFCQGAGRLICWRRCAPRRSLFSGVRSAHGWGHVDEAGAACYVGDTV